MYSSNHDKFSVKRVLFIYFFFIFYNEALLLGKLKISKIFVHLTVISVISTYPLYCQNCHLTYIACNIS